VNECTCSSRRISSCAARFRCSRTLFFSSSAAFTTWKKESLNQHAPQSANTRQITWVSAASSHFFFDPLRATAIPAPVPAATDGAAASASWRRRVNAHRMLYRARCWAHFGFFAIRSSVSPLQISSGGSFGGGSSFCFSGSSGSLLPGLAFFLLSHFILFFLCVLDGLQIRWKHNRNTVMKNTTGIQQPKLIDMHDTSNLKT
jgi:hypothetical protein